MNEQNTPDVSRRSRKRTVIISSLLIVIVLFAATIAYASYQATRPHTPSVAQRGKPTATATPSPTPSPTPTPIPPTPTPTPIPPLPVVTNLGSILGVEGDPQTTFTSIHWVRLGYPTCGWGNLTGKTLKNTIDTYHLHDVHVLLTVCQGRDDPSLYDTKPLNDAAQGGPDAVQCGNEEMKYDASVSFLYIQPAHFAKFYDLCERAMHAVRANIPILLGSLDPHVGGIDYQPLLNQVDYLNQMQYAMNTQVHPGGNWNWHTKALGLIDSWHNGYPDGSVNSLYNLFLFWAQQFGVDLGSGALGQHLWVVEGTGCFKGCGIDPYNSYQVAVSHIYALITDVQTAMNSHIPFFYFSGKDFISSGFYWPIGVLDPGGNPKPIRQDLPMGARVLTLSCSGKAVTVSNQESLLAKMYSGCSLPGNYASILAS